MRWLVIALILCVVGEARADRVKLRVGTLAVDGSTYMTDILAMSAEIERRSSRTIRLSWLTAGQLGDEGAMADLVATDQLDGGGFSETGMIALVPEMAVWQYPGLFSTYEEVDRATGALDATTRELFAKRGLTFAMWADLGFSHLFSTTEITSLRDVLTRAAPLLTVPIDGALTKAITSGRATAWTLPPLYMLVINTTTPARHALFMTDLRYRYVVGGLVLSKAAWAKLSVAQRKIVMDVCAEWQPKIRASWRQETQHGMITLVRTGLAVRASSKAETTAFVTASAKSRDAHARTVGLGDLVAKIVAATK